MDETNKFTKTTPLRMSLFSALGLPVITIIDISYLEARSNVVPKLANMESTHLNDVIGIYLKLCSSTITMNVFAGT